MQFETPPAGTPVDPALQGESAFDRADAAAQLAMLEWGLEVGATGTGQRWGRYTIIETLQRGGMGEVVLAEVEDQAGWRSRVVLKRLLADLLSDERYVQMFLSEAQVMSRLNHPNIVKLFDLPMIEGKQCLALEYVHGKNVYQLIKRCRALRTGMPVRVALHIVCEVLKGLHYAHTFVLDDGRPLDLVHRDVTPGNMLVSFDGEVKITDFGIAKSTMSRLSTTVGVVKGTTRYLSPEQIRGSPATQRSDVFSTAVVAVEMLTGQPLFDRGSVPPTLFAIAAGERPPVAEMLPPEALLIAPVLERALSTDPLQRQESAEALRMELAMAALALGPPMDQAGVGAFVRELFPEHHEPLGAFEVSDSNMSGLDSMDLTYLFEIRDPIIASSDIEQAREALREMATGSRPLDAEQFRRDDGERLMRARRVLKRTVVEKLPLEPRVSEVPLSRPPPRDPRIETREREVLPTPESAAVVLREVMRRAASSPGRTEAEEDAFSSGDLPSERPRLRAGSVEGIPSRPRPSSSSALVRPVSRPGLIAAARAPEWRRALERVRELAEGVAVPLFGGTRGKIALFALGIACGALAMRLGGAPEPAAPAVEATPEIDAVAARDAELARQLMGEVPMEAEPEAVPDEAAVAHAPAADEAVALEGDEPPAEVEAVEGELEEEGPPAPEAIGFGKIDVRRPRGARILVDGVALPRRAPLLRYSLPAGTHRVSVIKGNWRRTFTVEVKRGTRIDLTPR